MSENKIGEVIRLFPGRLDAEIKTECRATANSDGPLASVSYLLDHRNPHIPAVNRHVAESDIVATIHFQGRGSVFDLRLELHNWVPDHPHVEEIRDALQRVEYIWWSGVRYKVTAHRGQEFLPIARRLEVIYEKALPQWEDRTRPFDMVTLQLSPIERRGQSVVQYLIIPMRP